MSAPEVIAAEPPAARLEPRGHLFGVTCAAAGAVAWSVGALLIRLVPLDPWTVLFWRSASIALIMLVYLALVRRGTVIASLRGAGLPAIAAGLFMALSMMLYVNSLSLTSVANTLILISTNPFIAAALALIILRERVAPRMWIVMAVALAGMAVMVGDSIGGGTWMGDVLAIACATTFALSMIVLRRFKHLDMTPQVLMAGLWAMALTFPLAQPMSAAPFDIAICLAMGVSLTTGMVLFVHGLRHISAAEAGLLSMLESILAPIWVWLALGEQPRPLALVGGIVVLGAVAFHALMHARDGNKRKSAA